MSNVFALFHIRVIIKYIFSLRTVLILRKNHISVFLWCWVKKANSGAISSDLLSDFGVKKWQKLMGFIWYLSYSYRTRLDLFVTDGILILWMNEWHVRYCRVESARMFLIRYDEFILPSVKVMDYLLLLYNKVY